LQFDTEIRQKDPSRMKTTPIRIFGSRRAPSTRVTHRPHTPFSGSSWDDPALRILGTADGFDSAEPDRLRLGNPCLVNKNLVFFY